jgi:hypothetical protein
MLMLSTIDRRGKRSDETMRALAERDRLIAEAAATFMSDRSSLSAATRLHEALSRYQQGGWRRHRTEHQCPTRLCGRLDGYCWRILRARDAVPSERTIRRVLASPFRGQ